MALKIILQEKETHKFFGIQVFMDPWGLAFRMSIEIRFKWTFFTKQKKYYDHTSYNSDIDILEVFTSFSKALQRRDIQAYINRYTHIHKMSIQI